MSGNFSVEELVIDDSFCNYCFQKNESDILHWKQYIHTYPSQKEKIDEATQIVLGLRATLRQEEEKGEKLQSTSGQVVPMKFLKPARNRIMQYAAACIIVAVSTAAYFLFIQKGEQQTQIAKNTEPQDVKAPGTNRAMITLGNGQKIYLDSSGNGTLAVQGNVKLMKLANGEIAYQPGSEAADGEMQYNTLVNPKGSQVINMVLTDGSKVWLNAGSSLIYPVAFTGNERKVSITGEAYFEVAHDARKPFRVSKEAMQIEVLGTHFNVNAFDDETEIKVTLLEGSVKVNKGNKAGILKPGQQATVIDNININNNVDVDAVMAWKNGLFHFEKASLQDVLKQLARWYDVEVIYEQEVPKKNFVGEMERGLTLSQVLRLLEKNNVRFKIEGKKIIVLR